MYTPRVSVIMPAFNAAAYMQESIDSVIAQSFSNWELIIIDDGSEDDTSVIAKQYQADDNRIKYYYQKNGKQGKARNLGIEKSTGSLLAFLDADDLWLPDKLKISIDLFESEKHDLFFSEAYVFSDSKSLNNITSLKTLGIVQGIYHGKNGLSNLLYKNQIPLLTVLVKKEAVMAVGCFRNRGLGEDYELWLNLLAAGYSLQGTDLPLAAYRLHPSSSSFKDRLSVVSVSTMLTDFFQEHPNFLSCFKPQIKVWLKRYLLNHARSCEGMSQFPSVFKDFAGYITSYKLILKFRSILPERVFYYLINKTLR